MTLPDESTVCGWEDCDQQAVESLMFKKLAGHVHNCSSHGAFNREWADVSDSRQFVDGKCAYPCTPMPIATHTPPPIAP